MERLAAWVVLVLVLATLVLLGRAVGVVNGLREDEWSPRSHGCS